MESAFSLSSPEAELSPLAPTLSSFSSSSDTEEEVVNQGFDRRFTHRFSAIFNWIDFPARGNISIACGDQCFSCFIMALFLWFFVSVTIIVGVYGPRNFWIGPNSSILVEPNPIFVQSVKVKGSDDSKSGLELFGFYRSPPLDVIVNWSESRLLSISPLSFKGWPYYLNNGASLNISYNVKSEGSSALLVVDQGIMHVSQSWSEEPTYQKSALSWNLIRGSGVIEVKISEASTYYIAVSHLNMRDIEVKVDIDVRAVLYDTKQSFYKCTFSNGECTFNAMSLLGNSVVLTSPALRQGASIEEWYVRFSYQPRLSTYLIGTGLVMCFMLVAFQFWKRLGRYLAEDGSTSSQRARLLENKDDDGSSMGSSTESFAADDNDLEGFMGNEGDSNRRLCAICFDAPRDCFFLPCGHCVSCYQCGTKVAEAGGSCPICRRKIKKVKRIFTV